MWEDLQEDESYVEVAVGNVNEEENTVAGNFVLDNEAVPEDFHRSRSPSPRSHRQSIPFSSMFRRRSPVPSSSRQRSPVPSSSRQRSPVPSTSRQRSPVPSTSHGSSPLPSTSRQRTPPRSHHNNFSNSVENNASNSGTVLSHPTLNQHRAVPDDSSGQENARLEQRIELPIHLRVRDGRLYYISRRNADQITVHLRCHNNCGGTAKVLTTDIDNIIPMRQRGPTCVPQENLESLYLFKNALKDALKQWQPLKTLFDAMLLIYPEVRSLVSYSTLRTSMLRWRQINFPPSPNTLSELGEILSNRSGNLLEYYRGQLTCNTIVDANNNIHVVFRDINFIRVKFQAIETILIDGTFQCCPNIQGCTQIVTISGVRFNHAFPIYYALMSSSTKTAYTSILLDFVSIIRSNRISVVLSDFEISLRQAIYEVFVNARVAGCNVHYDRAMHRYLHDNGLYDVMRQSPEVMQAVKRMIALPFLPSREINRTALMIQHSLSVTAMEFLERFFEYWTRQWSTTITPEGISIYGLENRTNNAIESFHATLLRVVGIRPQPWEFIRGILRIQDNIVSDEIRLGNGLRVSRIPRYSSRFSHNTIHRLWHLHYTGRMTSLELLDAVSNLKGTSYFDSSREISEDLRRRHKNFVFIDNRIPDPEINLSAITNFEISNFTRMRQEEQQPVREEMPEDIFHDVQAETWAMEQFAVRDMVPDRRSNSARPSRGNVRRSSSRGRGQGARAVPYQWPQLPHYWHPYSMPSVHTGPMLPPPIIPPITPPMPQLEIMISDIIRNYFRSQQQVNNQTPQLPQGPREPQLQQQRRLQDQQLQYDLGLRLQPQEPREPEPQQRSQQEQQPQQPPQCIICVERIRNTTFIPCGHASFCYECANRIYTESNACPICRNRAESIIRLYT